MRSMKGKTGQTRIQAERSKPGERVTSHKPLHRPAPAFPFTDAATHAFPADKLTSTTDKHCSVINQFLSFADEHCAIAGKLLSVVGRLLSVMDEHCFLRNQLLSV